MAGRSVKIFMLRFSLGAVLLVPQAPAAATAAALPKPEPMYFSFLTGPHRTPAILVRMDMTIYPKRMSIYQALSDFTGVHDKQDHPVWVTARVCSLVSSGRGGAAKPLFADTPAAVQLWKYQIAGGKHSILGVAALASNASYRIAWETRAGPLAGCGWLLVPKPGDGRRRRWGAMLSSGYWAKNACLFAFALRRDDKRRYKILGPNDLPYDDPFSAVMSGITAGEARPPFHRTPSLESGGQRSPGTWSTTANAARRAMDLAALEMRYARVAYNTTAKGCALARGDEHSHFSIFFRLRPVPKLLINEVESLRHDIRANENANPHPNGVISQKARVAPSPFGPATSDYFKEAKHIRAIWMIQGRRVSYALFSGRDPGRRLWLVKLRKTAHGYASFELASRPRILRHPGSDALLGTDGGVTPTTRFLASKLRGVLIPKTRRFTVKEAWAKNLTHNQLLNALARVAPHRLVWRIGAPATPKMVVVTIPKAHPLEITEVETGDSYVRARLIVIKPWRRYAIVFWPTTTAGLGGWMPRVRTNFILHGRPVWLRVPIEIFPSPMNRSK